MDIMETNCACGRPITTKDEACGCKTWKCRGYNCGLSRRWSCQLPEHQRMAAYGLDEWRRRAAYEQVSQSIKAQEKRRREVMRQTVKRDELRRKAARREKFRK